MNSSCQDPEKFCVKFTLCNASQPVVDEKKVRCVCVCVCVRACVRNTHTHAPVIPSFIQITSKPLNVDVNSDLCKACQVFAEYIKPVILANSTLVRFSFFIIIL